MQFSGQVVLVAGGTGGLGRTVSLAFLEEGAKVIVTYRKPEEFTSLKSAAGGNVASLEGEIVDVTDQAAVTQLADKILSTHGRLDALVNTVGGYAGGTNIWETDPAVFSQMLSLNLNSGLVLSRAVVPAMIKAAAGSIVNVASKSALDHAPRLAAYSVSKAAALALMDSLAQEVQGTGVRVNTILPSIIDTEANRKAMPSANFAKWPKPDEIARVILFLCSPDAKVIHGAALPVYGAA